MLNILGFDAVVNYLTNLFSQETIDSDFLRGNRLHFVSDWRLGCRKKGKDQENQRQHKMSVSHYNIALRRFGVYSKAILYFSRGKVQGGGEGLRILIG